MTTKTEFFKEQSEYARQRAPVDIQVRRYQKAVVQMETWQRKAKAASNRLLKYKAQVRRYEKIFEADGRLAALKGKGE